MSAVNSDMMLSSYKGWLEFQPRQGSLAISLQDDNFLSTFVMTT